MTTILEKGFMNDFSAWTLGKRAGLCLVLLAALTGCRLNLEPLVEPEETTVDGSVGAQEGAKPAPAYSEDEWAELRRRSDAFPNDVLREGHVGYVVHVVDGDTLDVQVRDRYLKTRFQGASAPECEKDTVQLGRMSRLQCVADDEFYGLKSSQTLQDMVDGHEVIVYCEGVGAGNPCQTDHYGRSLSNLRLDDGRDVGEELLRAGAGWASTAFESETRARFCAAEYFARNARVGMWAEGDVQAVLTRMSAGTQRWYRQHDARCDEALKGL